MRLLSSLFIAIFDTYGRAAYLFQGIFLHVDWSFFVIYFFRNGRGVFLLFGRRVTCGIYFTRTVYMKSVTCTVPR